MVFICKICKTYTIITEDLTKVHALNILLKLVRIINCFLVAVFVCNYFCITSNIIYEDFGSGLTAMNWFVVVWID